jgi:hypothetical protein
MTVTRLIIVAAILLNRFIEARLGQGSTSMSDRNCQQGAGRDQVTIVSVIASEPTASAAISFPSLINGKHLYTTCPASLYRPWP